MVQIVFGSGAKIVIKKKNFVKCLKLSFLREKKREIIATDVYLENMENYFTKARK